MALHGTYPKAEQGTGHRCFGHSLCWYLRYLIEYLEDVCVCVEQRIKLQLVAIWPI